MVRRTLNSEYPTEELGAFRFFEISVIFHKYWNTLFYIYIEVMWASHRTSDDFCRKISTPLSHSCFRKQILIFFCKLLYIFFWTSYKISQNFKKRYLTVNSFRTFIRNLPQKFSEFPLHSIWTIISFQNNWFSECLHGSMNFLTRLPDHSHTGQVLIHPFSGTLRAYRHSHLWS